MVWLVEVFELDEEGKAVTADGADVYEVAEGFKRVAFTQQNRTDDYSLVLLEIVSFESFS